MPKALTAQGIEKLRPDPVRRLEIPDAVVPGLYFVLQPSGSRSWAVRYRFQGKTRKATLGAYPALDLATGRKRAREALEAISAGRDPGAEKIAARRIERLSNPDRDLVSTLVAEFMTRHVWANNSARTAEEADRTFRNHVLPFWGGRRIEDITRRDVIECLDAITDRGTPIAANRALAVIRKFFSWCESRSVIERSPCAGVSPPAVEASRDRVLSDDELRLVWAATGRIGFPFGPIVRLLLLTAQRRDEVAGFQRRELKEKGALWTIPGERTKNGEPHDVPLSPAAQDIISALPRIGRSEYLFTTTGKTPVSGYSNAKERLDRAMLALAREEAEERGDDPDEVGLEPWFTT